MADQIVERRRSRIDLIAAILEVCLRGSRKTRIMYSAGINPRDVSDIISFLLQKGLLYLEHDGEEHGIYRTMSKGMKFLEAYRAIMKVLE